MRALHAVAQHRRKKTAGTATEQVKSHTRELRALCAIMSMMGLAWVFGIFINTGDGDASLFLQYCFAAFATLQRFFVFVFYVLLNPNAKEETYSSLQKSTISTLFNRSRRDSHVFPSSGRRPTYVPTSSKSGGKSVREHARPGESATLPLPADAVFIRLEDSELNAVTNMSVAETSVAETSVAEFEAPEFFSNTNLDTASVTVAIQPMRQSSKGSFQFD